MNDHNRNLILDMIGDGGVCILSAWIVNDHFPNKGEQTPLEQMDDFCRNNNLIGTLDHDTGKLAFVRAETANKEIR